MPEVEIGVVKHYFDKPSVAAIEIRSGELAVGDTIHVVGHTTNVTTTIESMQIEHLSVPKAAVGDVVGTKLAGKAREHDRVFKIVP